MDGGSAHGPKGMDAQLNFLSLSLSTYIYLSIYFIFSLFKLNSIPKEKLSNAARKGKLSSSLYHAQELDFRFLGKNWKSN